jgi:hypothetical protein
MLATSRTQAQFSWNNPAGGDWLVGGNWVGGVPASTNTTALTFSDVVAQASTFTATNNISDPFTLNSLTVNHTAGTVTIAGACCRSTAPRRP